VQDFPNVDPAKFEEWQKAQLRATDIFLWATWGAFFIKLFLSLAARRAELTFEAASAFVILIIVGWIVGLVVAVVHGNNANKLRVAAGIDWPKSKDNSIKAEKEVDVVFRCPECDKELRKGERFCSYCSKEIDWSDYE
jgi:hypothetical protein